MHGPRRERAVLHVMRMTGVSGSENHLAVLAEEQARRGWAVDLLVPTPDAEPLQAYVQRLAAVCRSVTVERMRGDASLALLRTLGRHMRSGRYDVVHCHLVHADWHAALASLAGQRAALVSTKHNHDPFRERPSVQTIERLTACRFQRTLVISDSLGEFVLRTAKTGTVTVRYGLPDADPVSGRSGGGPDLLAVGRLEEQKGFEVLVAAMPAVLESHPDAQLAIAGEGSQRGALERQIAALGLERSVTLLGARSDVTELMSRSRMLVHPARWEGFGLVLLEAMAASLPVVASAVGGVPEVVAEGETGHLVPAGDPAALAAAVTRVLADPGEAAALGAAGERRLRERFAPGRMAQETLDVYDELMAGAARR